MTPLLLSILIYKTLSIMNHKMKKRRKLYKDNSLNNKILKKKKPNKKKKDRYPNLIIMSS
jgi:hypothetical protein